MRYVKCANCEAEIAGKQKYILYKVTETKGEHRNSKQQAILKLCSKCGYNLYKYKKAKINRKIELSILYPQFDVNEHNLSEFNNLERIKDIDPKWYETKKELIKTRENDKKIIYFTPSFKRWMRELDYDISKIWDRICNLDKFLKDDKTLQTIKNMNETQKVALDESLRYIQTEIQKYANDIENIRNTISEKTLPK